MGIFFLDSFNHLLYPSKPSLDFFFAGRVIFYFTSQHLTFLASYVVSPTAEHLFCFIFCQFKFSQSVSFVHFTAFFSVQLTALFLPRVALFHTFASPVLAQWLSFKSRPKKTYFSSTFFFPLASPPSSSSLHNFASRFFGKLFLLQSSLTLTFPCPLFACQAFVSFFSRLLRYNTRLHFLCVKADFLRCSFEHHPRSYLNWCAHEWCLTFS